MTAAALLGTVAWPVAVGLLVLLLVLTGVLCWVVASAARTRRLASLITAYRAGSAPYDGEQTG
jgi:uncharacterized integral membrane protein